MATTETSLNVYDKNLFENLTSFGHLIVFEPIRVMTANRLAEFGSQWSEMFEKFNSGTYNNQWMIIDYNKINETKGLLYVLEQLPNKIIKDDQTQILKERGYWKSYNRAYYKEIFELSGAQKVVEKYGGDWFTYDKTPRSVIIDRDYKNITDMDTFMSFMRYYLVDFILYSSRAHGGLKMKKCNKELHPFGTSAEQS